MRPRARGVGLCGAALAEKSILLYSTHTQRALPAEARSSTHNQRALPAEGAVLRAREYHADSGGRVGIGARLPEAQAQLRAVGAQQVAKGVAAKP